MIRLAANLSFLFAEMPFLDRFAAARRAGFSAVEFTFIYDLPVGATAQRCRENGLKVALFNVPPGNIFKGDAGMGALPGRETEAREGVELALDYAEFLGCPAIHFLAGNVPQDAEPKQLFDTYVANLRWAADAAVARGKTITIEPLNGEDRPHYYLRTVDQAVSVIRAVDRPNVRLQFDLYHCQKTERDLPTLLEIVFPLIGHVQIAGVPGRHEPDIGMLDVAGLLGHLERLCYSGYVGCEYLPVGETVAGLGWARRWLALAVAR